MLIIFDLDDTLIDTSGSVTPFKLEKVIEAMVGRSATSVELASLLSEDAALCSSLAAVESYGSKNGCTPTQIQQGIVALNAPLPEGFVVKLTPGAKEVIEEMKPKGILALVTVGHSPFQLDKLKKAGIEASSFSKINVLQNATKKSAYMEIAEEFSVSPEAVWVCGDRIKTDLLPAHELGFNTVHMRWGRGKNVVQEPWIDYSIGSLTELKDIIR